MKILRIWKLQGGQDFTINQLAMSILSQRLVCKEYVGSRYRQAIEARAIDPRPSNMLATIRTSRIAQGPGAIWSLHAVRELH